MEIETDSEVSRASVSADTVRAIVDRLLGARANLARRSMEEIVDSLDRVVTLWLQADSKWRRRAEQALVQHAGYSLPMLRHGLPLLFEPLRGEGIVRLLDEELGDRRRIDSSRRGPRLIAHVLPGNIPALAAAPVCLSLAVKSAALVKPGAGDRWIPSLFAASIAELDADLGACVAAVYWPGGDEGIEREAFARADVVEASGGDPAVAELGRRVRGRFIGHGNRISFAFLGCEVAGDSVLRGEAASALAEDISVWDQQGCLSPQVVFVERPDRAGLDRMANHLAAALEQMANTLPPRRLSLEEQTAVLHFRQQAEWGIASPGHVIMGDALRWTIVVENEAALRPTCLQRTVRLQPVPSLQAVVGALQSMRPRLEAAGLAVDPARHAEISTALCGAGVHRVCRAGEMQRPDLSWKPGGRPRVADWMSPGG